MKSLPRTDENPRRNPSARHNLLEPVWLAILLFVAIPAAGAALIAWLVEVYHSRFWWRARPLSALSAAMALPVFIFPPSAGTILGVAAVWLVATRWGRVRELPRWLPARIAAYAVFAVVVVLGLINLTSDMRELL